MNISVVEGDGEMLRYSKHDLQMVVNDAIRFTGNLLRIAAEVAETALLKDIEAQQQEIDRLIMEITELRESNQALKDYAENADADKDEQVGCEVCNKGLPCENGCDGFCDICDIPEVWKTIHKTGQYNYCPICGKKLGTVPICNVTKLPCAGCNPVCEHRTKS